MRLLIKKHNTRGYAAHLADDQGKQLCATPIKRIDWDICDIWPEGQLICQRCRHLDAKRARRVDEQEQAPVA